MHLWVDVFTSVGVMAGLIIIRLTGFSILDPVLAILVAVMILKASWDLTKRSLVGLADRSLPANEIEIITGILKLHPHILGYHKMRTRQNGAQRELDIHLTIDPQTSVHDAHEMCNHVEAEIEAEIKAARKARGREKATAQVAARFGAATCLNMGSSNSSTLS